MKLGIGSVQFGLNYGISNVAGQTAVEEVRRILAVAMQSGIDTIDTAPLYGDSEAIIGTCIPENHCFKIVTKTPCFSRELICRGAQTVLAETFDASLQKLKQRKIYGLLFHQVEDLFSPAGDELFNKAIELKKAGLVQKIGVSLYSANQIEEVASRFDIDLVQVPVNVFDQAILKPENVTRLQAARIEVHARSAFLQGLLLMNPEALPVHMQSASKPLKLFHRFAQNQGMTPLQACLGFVASIPWVDKIICGTNNLKQFEELLQTFSTQVCITDYLKLSVDDDYIINPSVWRIS